MKSQSAFMLSFVVFCAIFGLTAAALNETEVQEELNRIERQSNDIFRSHYNLIAQHNLNESDLNLDKIRALKPAIRLALHELNLLLEDSPAENFGDRLTIPLAKIQLFKAVEMLDDVAGAILLYRAGITGFPERGTPNQAIAEQLQLHANFTIFHQEAEKLDRELLEPVLAKLNQGQKVSDDERAQLDAALLQFVWESETHKAELERVYTSEVEKLESDGHLLDLSQSLQARLAISDWYFVVDFVHNYRKLLATLF